MSNVGLARPQAVTGAIITCSVFGTTGTDYFIKVEEFRPRFIIPDKEDSGDGDAAPSFTAALWMYCSGVFNGWMIQQASPGSTFLLANFIDSSKNPLSASLKFNFATQQILTIPKVLLTGFFPIYKRTLEIVPCAISFKATNSHPTWSTT